MIGVSFDPPWFNALFKGNESFPFPLWSDVERELALIYGAAASVDTIFASRITVLLDPEGSWVLHYPVDVVAAKSLYVHAQTILDDLALLLGE